MKVIIAGGRDIWVGPEQMDRIVADSGLVVTQLVCGGARGVDESGATWANSRDLPMILFPADWNKHGRGAGMIRNRQMAEHADALIAVWDGQSRGTKNMIEEMRKREKPVHVHMVEGRQ